jgi:hypothetical protein
LRVGNRLGKTKVGFVSRKATVRVKLLHNVVWATDKNKFKQSLKRFFIRG